jgi:hypothetical protein
MQPHRFRPPEAALGTPQCSHKPHVNAPTRHRGQHFVYRNSLAQGSLRPHGAGLPVRIVKVPTAPTAAIFRSTKAPQNATFLGGR